MKDLQSAKTRLMKGDCTCVLCKKQDSCISIERGVKPLVKWLQSGNDFFVSKILELTQTFNSREKELLLKTIETINEFRGNTD